jgi:hypothetical protein
MKDTLVQSLVRGRVGALVVCVLGIVLPKYGFDDAMIQELVQDGALAIGACMMIISKIRDVLRHD